MWYKTSFDILLLSQKEPPNGLRKRNLKIFGGYIDRLWKSWIIIDKSILITELSTDFPASLVAQGSTGRVGPVT